MRFLLTPLREGRPIRPSPTGSSDIHFYSRPCGRGDASRREQSPTRAPFLLTPLREGRREVLPFFRLPLGFLLTPLREGRPSVPKGKIYATSKISTHAPARGATFLQPLSIHSRNISTHAPARGATRISFLIYPDLFGFLLTPLREGRLKSTFW